MTNETKTPRGHGYGSEPSDVNQIRRFMKEQGLTEAQLAKEAGISQQHLNRFLNKKVVLSAAASDRVIAVLMVHSDAKKAAETTGLSPEAAARIRAKANLIDTTAGNETHPSSFDLLLSLAPPPRDPVAYKQWKATRIEQLSAVEELGSAKTWITHVERQRDDLKRELLEAELKANQELIATYRRVVALEKQLRDAGITPVE